MITQSCICSLILTFHTEYSKGIKHGTSYQGYEDIQVAVSAMSVLTETVTEVDMQDVLGPQGHLNFKPTYF